MAIALVAAMLLVATVASVPTAKDSFVSIHIYNPYGLDVGCEVKCDWDGASRKYGYYNNILVPGKGDFTLRVSRNYNSCEVWPKIKW